MDHKFRALLQLAFFLTLSVIGLNLHAQQGAQNDYLDRVGPPDFSINDPLEAGSLNVANGTLHLEIPMGQLAQRGKLPFSIKLVYDNQIWGHESATLWAPSAMMGTMGGWRVVLAGQFVDLNACGSTAPFFYPNNCPNANYSAFDTECDVAPNGIIGFYTTFQGFNFTDATGNTKTFGITTYASPAQSLNCMPDTPTGASYADDNSGYFMSVTNYNQMVVYDNNGNVVSPIGEDSNGNTYTFNSNGMVDFNGRNPVLRTISGNNTYYDVLNSEGGRSRYTLATTTLNVHTAFGNPFMTEYSGTIQSVQSLTLPNGRSYTFTYDSGTAPGNYGMLNSITLPTGAQIQYGYNTFVDSVCNYTRWITSRTSQGNQWSYAPSVVTSPWVSCPFTSQTQGTGNQGIQQITANRPDGTSMVYTFTLTGVNSGAWVTNAVYRDVTGRTVETITKEYTQSAGGQETLFHPFRITTTIPSGSSSISKKTEYSWDFPNVSEVREWDFYPGTAPSTPTRITDATYTDANPTYVAKHILSKPTAIVVQSGDRSITPFQANFEYDNYTNGLSASGAVQHDSSFNTSYVTRGNVTAVSRLLNTNGSFLTTRNQYDDAGNITSTTDPSLHITTVSYTDVWADTTCTPVGGNAAAYPTTVTNAKAQSQHSTYNSCTGTVATSTDVNNNTTNFYYVDSSNNADPFDRLLKTVFPPDPNNNRPTKTTTYNESTLPLSSTVSQSITPTQNLTETDTLDNLGRIVQSALTSDPQGTDYTVTVYDALNRKSQLYNPTRCSTPTTNCGEATWGKASFAYDVLGRSTGQTSQDGGTVINSYAGNSVTTTDQAGKQRRSVSDGLGRLIEVDEPSAAGVQVNYHATMQQDGNFVLSNSASTPIWSTGTGGTNASSILMQDDGNLVLYIFKWSAGTYATPSPGPFPAQGCNIGSYLMINQRINANQCIVSPHGQYMLFMASDGNFFIYDLAHNAGTWGPGTYGHPGAYAIMQGDGNLCVYTATNTYLWCSGTNGTFAERLDMEDDGRIIIYKSAWNSGTSTGQFNWTTLVHPGCDIGIGTGWTGVLGSGQCFVSPNGHFELIVQANGNMVINDLGQTPNVMLWQTSTAVSPTDPSVAMRTLYTYDLLDNLTCVEQHGTATSGTGCPASPPGPTGPPISPDPNNAWRRRLFAYDSLSRLRWASNPESGVTTYTYDSDGNLLQKTSPAPNQVGSTTQTISYCYDVLHRVTGKAYSPQTCTNGLLPSGTAVASYFYDQTSYNGLTILNGVGSRTGMSDQSGAEAWSYDSMGHPLSDRRTTNSITMTTSYLYNLMGSPTSITYPSGHTISYTYDGAGRPTSVADSPNSINYATLASYAPTGALLSVKNGTNLASTLYYNNRLQPCRIFVSTGTSAPSNCGDLGVVGNVIDFTYGFNLSAGDNGNVASVANNRDSTRSQSFSYDPLDRISTGQTISTTGTKCFGETFGYDAWGNLLSIGGLTGYSGCTQENPGFAGVNAQNQMNTYSYDAAGNMTAGAYTYDAENHLLTAGGVTYTYDGDGKRVQKSSGKLYWYGMGVAALDETDLSGATNNSTFNEYVFFGGKRVARRDSSNSVFYYFADHLGTSRVMVQSGQTSACYDADFYPFGGERPPVINSCPQNYKFTAKERDTETGLDAAHFRYYNSSQGRFPSPDPSNFGANPNAPQTWNGYSYASGNPMNATDPSGLDCIYVDEGQSGVAIKKGDCVSDKDNGIFINGTIDPNSLQYNSNTSTLSYNFIDDGNHNFGKGEIGDVHFPSPDVCEATCQGVFHGPDAQRIWGTSSRTAERYLGIPMAIFLSLAVPGGLDAGGPEIQGAKAGSSLRIIFKHGARHLVGTGLAQAAVEAAIRAEIEGALAGASASGEFWGVVVVDGQQVFYRAFTLTDGTISVGTYTVGAP